MVGRQEYTLSFAWWDSDGVSLAGVEAHVPNVLPVLQPLWVLSQFQVVLVSDFPAKEAVVCKQSDFGGLHRNRKIVDVSQEQMRSQNCPLGYAR